MTVDQTAADAFNEVVEDTLRVAFEQSLDQSDVITSVGSNGDPAYIQGFARNGLVYYPTFVEFDKSVTFDREDGRWERQGGTFTDQLLDFYGQVQYRASNASDVTRETTAAIERSAIDRFFNDYIEYFGPGKPWFERLRKRASEAPDELLAPFYNQRTNPDTGRVGWRIDQSSTERNEDGTIKPGDTAERRSVFDAVLTWSINTALGYGGAAFTRRGRTLVENVAKSLDIELPNGYRSFKTLDDDDKSIISAELSRFFRTGTRTYSDYLGTTFTNARTVNITNPMIPLWQSWTDTATNLDTLQTSTNIVLVRQTNLSTAAKNLSQWLSGGEDELSQEMIDTNELGNFGVTNKPTSQFERDCVYVYDDWFDDYFEECEETEIPPEDQIASNYRPVVPQLDRFSIQGGAFPFTGGTDITISMETSEGQASFSSGSTNSTKTTRSSGGRGGWFVLPFVFGIAGGSGEKSTTVEENRESFSDRMETSSSQTAVLTYPNSFRQTWQPTTSGPGMWFDKHALQNIQNSIEDGILPWVGHPKWPGGFGLQTPHQAKRMIRYGFAAPKSLIASPNPTIDITFASSEENASKFSSSSSKQTDWTKTRTVGWGTWFWGGTRTETTTGRDVSESSTTRSSFNKNKNEVTISTESIVPSINASNNGKPEEFDGYAGQLLGYVSEVLVDPILDENIIKQICGDAGLSDDCEVKSRGKKASLAQRDGKTIYNQNFSITAAEGTNYGNGDNYVFSGKGADVITGGEGDDSLFAENGNDLVKGGKGSDFLDGGIGINKLYGGPGADYFHISHDNFLKARSKGKQAIQKIKDFDASEGDVLWFTSSDLPWSKSQISQSGNDILYKFSDETYKIAELVGIDHALVADAISNARFII